MAVLNSFKSRRSISRGRDCTACPFHRWPCSVGRPRFTGILGGEEGKDCFFLRCLRSQGAVESSFLTAITTSLAFLAQGRAAKGGLDLGFLCLIPERTKT